MDKSPEAFRTISEVAESLETPAHVLRFWESRFPQIKPVKRAGGRRYYRPADVALLAGIRHLLHDEGMTIRGVQKILREQGVRHVAAMAAGSEGIEFDADLLDAEEEDFALPEPETAQIVALEPAVRGATPPPSAPAEVVRLRAVPEQSIPAPLPPVDEVPEAGHIWVEDEPEMELAPPAPLFPKPADTGPLWPGAGPSGLARPQGGLPDNLSEGFVVRGALRPKKPAITQDRLPLGEEETAPDLVADLVADALSEIVAQEVADSAAEHLAAASAAPASAGAALQLSGIAARLRALPRPGTPAVVAELLELHSRLGLLHAQMAEAQRARR